MKELCEPRSSLLPGLATVFLVWLVPTMALTADYPKPGDFQRGAQVWANNCGRCHNIRSAQDQRDDQWITSVFHMRVRAGLTGQQTRDVLTFLQASNKSASVATAPEPDATAPGATSNGAVEAGTDQQTAGNVSAGRTIYAQTCVVCHGPGGQGAVPGVPNIRDRLGKSTAALIQNITQGFQSPGAAMAMPPKGGNPDLSAADIQSVVAYMRATFR